MLAPAHAGRFAPRKAPRFSTLPGMSWPAAPADLIFSSVVMVSGEIETVRDRRLGREVFPRVGKRILIVTKPRRALDLRPRPPARIGLDRRAIGLQPARELPELVVATG